jgi:hypothetical protein
MPLSARPKASLGGNGGGGLPLGGKFVPGALGSFVLAEFVRRAGILPAALSAVAKSSGFGASGAEPVEEGLELLGASSDADGAGGVVTAGKLTFMCP